MGVFPSIRVFNEIESLIMETWNDHNVWDMSIKTDEHLEILNYVSILVYYVQ